jgi:hypothetical protein
MPALLMISYQKYFRDLTLIGSTAVATSQHDSVAAYKNFFRYKEIFFGVFGTYWRENNLTPTVIADSSNRFKTFVWKFV